MKPTRILITEKHKYICCLFLYYYIVLVLFERKIIYLLQDLIFIKTSYFLFGLWRFNNERTLTGSGALTRKAYYLWVVKPGILSVFTITIIKLSFFLNK